HPAPGIGRRHPPLPLLTRTPGHRRGTNMRILFVDDDRDLLGGLQDVMRRQRHKWEMVFAPGSQAALEAFQASDFDVVVTDLHMPVMDGATLLERVQQTHPQAVRIVLSGSAKPEEAVPAIRAAHQYLAKPCQPAALESAIDRALGLRHLVPDER